MAGKPGRSGRKPKPDSLKLAKGTYRADRFGDPSSKPDPGGVPEMPEFTLKESEEFWKEYIPMLVQLRIATSADAPRLQMMAEAWGLLRKATAAVNNDPIDKDARIAYAEYAKQFQLAAAEFGLNPSARSKIILPETKKPTIQGRQRG